MLVLGAQAACPIESTWSRKHTVICQMSEQGAWGLGHPGEACKHGCRVRRDGARQFATLLPGRHVRTSAAAPNWQRSALASRAACSLGIPWTSTYDFSPRRRASLYACVLPLPECIYLGIRENFKSEQGFCVLYLQAPRLLQHRCATVSGARLR